jgi:hypothetical protein
MPSSFYGDEYYRKNQAERTRRLWKEGLYNPLRKPLEDRICQNPQCNLLFKAKQSERKIYCGHSCAAHVNNHRRPIKTKTGCKNCGKIVSRLGYIYCSNKCQSLVVHQEYISRWQRGLEDGNRGITTILISNHIRRYLWEKYDNKCARCEWNKINPITGIPPLEVDHIDGNSNNNHESNLTLLCPNCHALTPTFKNLNKGKGRSWRMAKIRANSLPA